MMKRITPIYFLVTLKGPDLIAITAHETILKKVEGGSSVIRLIRQDLFIVEPETKIETEEQVTLFAERLLKSTTYFFNPNKHLVRIGFGELPPVKTLDVDVSVSRCFIYETDLDPEKEAKNLAKRFDLPVRRLTPGTLWSIFTLQKPEKERISGLFSDIIASGDGETGLLCNTNYQSIKVFEGGWLDK